MEMLSLQLCHAMMSQPFVYFFCVGKDVPSDLNKLGSFLTTLTLYRLIYFYAAVFMNANVLKEDGGEPGWNYGSEIEDFYSCLAETVKTNKILTTEK